MQHNSNVFSAHVQCDNPIEVPLDAPACCRRKPCAASHACTLRILQPYLNLFSKLAGRVRNHTFRRHPGFASAAVGTAPEDWRATVAAVDASFDRRLRILTHDCRQYADELLLQLAGTNLFDAERIVSGTMSADAPDVLQW